MKEKKILAAAFAAAAAASFGGIDVTCDHPDALYRVGETAAFTVTVRDDATGAPVTNASATWSLDNFGWRRVTNGVQRLAAANPFVVKGALPADGFLRLNVRSGTNALCFAVGYDVSKIRQTAPRPADFDAYWAGEKARLAREVPLDPRVTRDAKLSDAKFDVYRVNFATFRGGRVYGFMSVPKDESKRPYLVHVNVPGAGPGYVNCPKRADRISLVMNVHQFEPCATPAEQKEKMNAVNRDLCAAAGMPTNRNTYCGSVGISISREAYHYHDVMLGIDRAIDWVAARPEADANRVVYSGSSQGGLFGVYLTYLNPKIRRAFVSVCAGAGHFADRQGRQNGWPNLIASQPAEHRAEAARHAAYFDAINFAAGIRTPIRFLVGFADQCCPPHNVYAAYNVLKSEDREIANAIGSGHNWHANAMGREAGRRYEDWLTDGKLVINVSDGAGLHDARTRIVRARAADRDCPIDVVLAGGDYELTGQLILTERVHGYRSSPTADVTFRAAPGARPRLCGGRRVTGWAKAPFNGRSDVWCADLSALKLKKRLALLYCDGTAMPLCRWPNADPKRPYSGGWAYVEGRHTSMYTEIKGERDDLFAMRRADVRDWSHPEEALVNIFPRYNWWNAIRPVAGIDVTPSNAVVRLASRIREGFAPRAYDRYCLMGLREELDTPGEWYHDLAAGKVYFIPPAGTDPNAVRTAVVADPFTLFRFDRATNIVVRGVEACEAASFVCATGTDRVRVIDCRVHDVGTMDGSAVYASGTRNEVRDCDIWDTQGYGVTVSGARSDYAPETRDGNVVENNYIHHCGRMNRHGFGVMVCGQGSRVANNLMHDMPRGGIFYSGRFLTIVKNRIRHVNLEMEDTAAIYGGGYLSNVGTKINGNHVSDSIGFSHDRNGVYRFGLTCAWGIYLDDCSGGAEVVGNLVEHCSRGGMHMHCARFNVVSNNVFVSNGGSSQDPAQHSIRGWRTTDTGNCVKHLRTAEQTRYEKLVGPHPGWKRFPPLAYAPKDVPAPGGYIMQGNRIVNNIWYYPDEPKSFAITPGNYNVTNNLFDANIYFPGAAEIRLKHEGRELSLADWRAKGQDRRSVVGDPLFADPAKGDYSFRPGSPARALGIVPVRPQDAGLYLNANRRSFPREAEGVREHPEWLAND